MILDEKHVFFGLINLKSAFKCYQTERNVALITLTNRSSYHSPDNYFIYSYLKAIFVLTQSPPQSHFF